MQKLPEVFRDGGFNMRQLKRQGNVILLEKSRVSWINKVYEVVIIRRLKGNIFPSGKVYPDREAMPSNEQWGTYGWSYYDREAAEETFNKLSNDTTITSDK